MVEGENGNGNGSKKATAYIVAIARAAGGSGVGILSGAGETDREILELRATVAAIKQEQADEEMRMVALIAAADKAAADRSRRVRTDLEDEVSDLELKVHSLELQMAREGRNPAR